MSWQAYWDNEGVPPKQRCAQRGHCPDWPSHPCCGCGEPAAPLPPSDSNFASLLEREPQEEGDKATDAEGWKRLYWSTIKTYQSTSDRIKSLEDVLVAIRARASGARRPGVTTCAEDALGEIVSLINETLDPCKPWCVQEPGRKHEGACVPIEEDDRGE